MANACGRLKLVSMSMGSPPVHVLLLGRNFIEKPHHLHERHCVSLLPGDAFDLGLGPGQKVGQSVQGAGHLVTQIPHENPHPLAGVGGEHLEGMITASLVTQVRISINSKQNNVTEQTTSVASA